MNVWEQPTNQRPVDISAGRFLFAGCMAAWPVMGADSAAVGSALQLIKHKAMDCITLNNNAASLPCLARLDVGRIRVC